MMRKKVFFSLALTAVAALQGLPGLAQDAAPVPEVLTLPEQIAGGREVTITVSEKPPADQAESLATWEAQVARFEAMYPNVHIEGQELEYNTAAFAALIASEQLPTL